MSAVSTIFRSAFYGDVLDALDHAETCHRTLTRETVATLGVDADTYRRLAVCRRFRSEAHEPEPRRLSWSDYPNGVQALPPGFEPPETYLA